MGERNWDTKQEILFLRGTGLGKWAPDSHRCCTAGRATMLRRYRQAALNRSNWDRIDKGKVLKYLDEAMLEFNR